MCLGLEQGILSLIRVRFEVFLFSFEMWKLKLCTGQGHYRALWGKTPLSRWFKGRSNEMCYISSCTTFIYFMFVCDDLLWHFYIKGLEENKRTVILFLPSANLSKCFIFKCCHVVLIILSTQYFEAIDLLRLKKIQYME